MAKQLRSENTQPQDIQFKHFGVLDAGQQSKGSVFTALAVNVVLALIAIVIGAAAAKVVHNEKKDIAYVVPIKEKPPEPKPPKPPPPKLIPPKPVVKPPEPKIVLPKVVVVEPPKPVAVQMPKPLPVVTPAPPKQVVAAAAPKPVAVSLARSASVVNNDPHPSAVALGHAENPIHPSNLPATAAINLGQKGLAGMPATNSGGGPPSTKVSLGSGQPNGQIGGTGVHGVTGVKLGGVTNGTPGGTGNGVGTRPQQVTLAQNNTPPPAQNVQLQKATVRTAPQVTFKPKPVYTADATTARIEGNVSVRIHVSANGAVTVIGVTSGLGHGLDQSAIQCAQGIRFKPAQDASGNPIDWEGVVKISFQLA